MKIYRISHFTSGAEHSGYSYYSSKKEAEKAQRVARKEYDELIAGDEYDEDDEGASKTLSGRDDIDVYDINLTKGGVLQFLNIHCGYPDNG